jgi:hypothetical protein
MIMYRNRKREGGSEGGREGGKEGGEEGTCSVFVVAL